MRVLSISTLFPSPARPAFGTFVANQMLAVASRGDIDLVMINPIGIPPWPLSLTAHASAARRTPAASTRDGLAVLHPRFTTIPRAGASSNPARLARAILPLARRLHAEARFDVVDAQFFFPDGPAAAIVADTLGLPLSIKARGSDIHFWSERPAALRQMRRAADRSAGMLAVSAALRADMGDLGLSVERIAVHYTGLDRERFRPIPRAEARAAVATRLGLDLPSSARLLVTPGTLIAIKGQRLAIEALRCLPATHLALAGTGPDEAMLRAAIANHRLSDRVHLLGQVSHELLPALLSASDAVVLPSAREGLANAWVEALACGAPLVIPDIGGAREVIQAPSAGRIAARDPRAIANALEDLLANPPAPQDVAANAARFSWEANAAQLAAHWRSLAGRD